MHHADVIVTSPSSPSSLPLWLTPGPKRGRTSHGRCRDAPCIHLAHPYRPRTAALPTSISRPPPRLHELPTLAASGFHPHPQHRAPEEEKRGGGRREGGVDRGSDAHAAAGAEGHLRSPHLDVVPPLLPLPAPPTSSSRVEPFFTATFIFKSHRP
jgi:hypothetical protein